MKKMTFIILILSLNCCSNENEEQPKQGNTVNLKLIPGKYIGNWSWDLGTGPISMEIAKSSSNSFPVKFYETSNLKPMFNSDGITPEAQGTLRIDGVKATISLTFNTDLPPCTGNYKGDGTRTEDGKLELKMDIVHNCAQDGEATWNLTKTSEL